MQDKSPPDNTTLHYREVPLSLLVPGSPGFEEFRRVNAPWMAAGVYRWMSLFHPDAPWPAFLRVVHRPETPQHWLGTIAAVWSSSPIQRFDDLLETESRGTGHSTTRPTGGTWHLIADTVTPEARGLGLGRALVEDALTWLVGHNPEAQVRTLSPAVGIPAQRQALLRFAQSPEAPDWLTPALRDQRTRQFYTTIRHLADEQGKPILPIMRLHLGAGATLESVLFDSRADEHRSAHITLRFAYDLSAEARAQQHQHYHTWCQARRDTIAAQRARALQLDGKTCYFVSDHQDNTVLSYL